MGVTDFQAQLGPLGRRVLLAILDLQGGQEKEVSEELKETKEKTDPLVKMETREQWAPRALQEKITGSNPSGASTFHMARQINQTFQLARSMDQILFFYEITQPIQ